MLSVKLVVIGGDAKNKEVQLKLPTVIGRGRGDGVSLTLPHKLVSRKHTELFEQEGKLFVKDLGSLNGTYVNNKRIAQRTPLNPNELLTLGNVTFRAVYDLQGVAAAPEVPEFQEVKPSEEVLDEEAKDGSDTNKSLIDINPADISDDAEAEADAIFAAASAVELKTADADRAADSDCTVEAPSAPEPVVEAMPTEEPAPVIEPTPVVEPEPTVDPVKEVEPVAKISPAMASNSVSGSSDIFGGATIDGATPEKSICMNALDGLPTADKNSEFEVQLNGLERPESVKNIEIDLDEPAAAASPEDSRLGSFLKKMPR